MIGQIPDEPGARAFGDYLVSRGIASQVEAEPEGWSVWVREEEQLAPAREAMARFLASRDAPEFQRAPAEARKVRAAEQAQQAAARKRYFDRDRVWRPGAGGIALTMALVAGCVAVAFLTNLGANTTTLDWFLMTKVRHVGPGQISFVPGLPEVRHWELWRLVTPIFIHFGWVHIVFNMIALVDLGSAIERKHGFWRFGVMVLVMAVLSNCGEHIFINNPRFGGMSGVLYGLFGYAWIRGKNDPRSGLELSQQTVVVMMVWFFACLFNLIPNVANAAHGVGLVVGMAWGFIAARLVRR